MNKSIVHCLLCVEMHVLSSAGLLALNVFLSRNFGRGSRIIHNIKDEQNDHFW